MNDSSSNVSTRRDFIKTTGRIAAASALAGVAIPHVHAASSELIQIALVGAGGRGSGAADNALSSKGGPTKLVAIADVFQDKLNRSYEGLKRKCGDKVDVSEDHKFIGFDGYQKAMDSLKPGDVVILTTAGFSVGAFPLCDSKRIECFHGKAAHFRWADLATDAQAGGGGHQQESESRCGADVASRTEFAGITKTHSGRGNRGCDIAARLPNAWTRRVGVFDEVARGAERVAVADPEFP